MAKQQQPKQPQKSRAQDDERRRGRDDARRGYDDAQRGRDAKHEPSQKASERLEENDQPDDLE